MSGDENASQPSVLELVLRIAKGELTADQAIEILRSSQTKEAST